MKKLWIITLTFALMLWTGQALAQDEDDLTSIFSEEVFDQPQEGSASPEQGPNLPALPPSMVVPPPPVPNAETLESVSPYYTPSIPSVDAQTTPSVSGTLIDPDSSDASQPGIIPVHAEQQQPAAPPPPNPTETPPEPLPNAQIPAAETQQENFSEPQLDNIITPDAQINGQVLTPPPLPWQSESREASGVPSQSGPLPDFDTSQGRWQQMEVGQFDRPRNAVPEEELPAQSAAPSANQPNQSGVSGPINSETAVPQTASGQTAAPTPSEPPERTETRQLFQDLLPDLSTPTLDSSGSASMTIPLSPPPSATSTPPGSSQSPDSASMPPMPQASVPARADEPSPSVSSETPAIAPALQLPQEDSNLAISKAGSVLVEQGLNPKVSSASILDPTTVTAPAPSKNPSPQRQPPPKPNQGEQAARSKNNNTSNSPSQAPKPPQPRVYKPNMTVYLINETGRSSVGEAYRNVLVQMGYKVLGLAEQPPTGSAGQTIITYMANHKGQAAALSRHLPGYRQLLPTNAQLPAEAVVTIR